MPRYSLEMGISIPPEGGQLASPGDERDSSLARLLEMLRAIRGSSHWGRRQDAVSAALCIEAEAQEFLNAVREHDHESSVKELADVFMMTVFAAILLEERGVSWQQVSALASRKLKERYPSIFQKGSPQLELFSDLRQPDSYEEERDWREAKKRELILEFSFCPNPKCDAFQEPGAPCLHFRSHRPRRLECTLCHGSYRLSESVLFPRARVSRRRLLLAIAHYVQAGGVKEAARIADVPVPTLEYWIAEVPHQANVLARLLQKRFGIDEHDTCTRLRGQSDSR